jgi:hypothetical protein
MPEKSEVNSGEGWYEFIHPTKATTNIAYIGEGGDLYLPENGTTYEDFVLASSRGNAYRLVRADSVEVDENTSDGFHTFKELYEMRMLLTAGFFGYLTLTTAKVCRSKKHSDGSVPFGGGWFIVVAELPNDIGQISFHYELKDWDLFDEIPEVDTPPVYDGHTTDDVADRIRRFLNR